MKFVLFMLCLTFVGCATGPTKILVQNCVSQGDNLYSCEEIPQKEVRPSKN